MFSVLKLRYSSILSQWHQHILRLVSLRRSTIFENQFLFSKNFTFRTIVLKTEYFIDMQVPWKIATYCYSEVFMRFFIFKVDIVNIKEEWKGFFCLREIVIHSILLELQHASHFCDHSYLFRGQNFIKIWT